MSFDLEPLGQRILVERVSEDMVGIIHVPDAHKKVSLRGRVLAVGSDCDWVEEGDEIFFGRYAPFSLPLEDVGENRPKELLIMNEEDVLCKIIKEDKPDAGRDTGNIGAVSSTGNVTY